MVSEVVRRERDVVLDHTLTTRDVLFDDVSDLLLHNRDVIKLISTLRSALMRLTRDRTNYLLPSYHLTRHTS